MSKGLKELDGKSVLEEIEMNHSTSPKRRTPRQPLSAFSKTAIVVHLMLATLLGALGLFVKQPTILVTAGIEVVVVALIMTGIRWVPLLGSIIGGFVLYVFTVVAEFPIYHLSHPKDVYGSGVGSGISFVMFVVMVLMFWGAAMLVITGIAAVIHNYSQRERHTPSWFKSALACACGVMFGAIILGAISQPAPAATASNGTPTVHLGAGTFNQTSITISKGSTLTLIDDGAFHHNISNGTWVNGQPVYNTETGEPAVRNKDLNTSGASLTVGPFTTAGTYHLLCSIHEGMTLTIIVQ